MHFGIHHLLGVCLCRLRRMRNIFTLNRNSLCRFSNYVPVNVVEYTGTEAAADEQYLVNPIRVSQSRQNILYTAVIHYTGWRATTKTLRLLLRIQTDVHIEHFSH